MNDNDTYINPDLPYIVDFIQHQEAREAQEEVYRKSNEDLLKDDSPYYSTSKENSSSLSILITLLIVTIAMAIAKPYLGNLLNPMAW